MADRRRLAVRLACGLMGWRAGLRADALTELRRLAGWGAVSVAGDRFGTCGDEVRLLRLDATEPSGRKWWFRSQATVSATRLAGTHPSVRVSFTDFFAAFTDCEMLCHM